MVASTDIKFYVHTNNNAPQLQNAYGSMIGVLDACLIDGIQIGVVSSLTASGTTVTATFGAAHNLMQYQVIKITGANQTEFNGEHRILSIPDTSSFTFELAAVPSVTTATGTISASLPPLGWEKPFSSSNPNGGGKAAYRSTNLLLPSRPFLRVVDELDPAYTATYAKYAKVGIVEDMTDIDTMLDVQAPYDSNNPDKNWVGSGSGTTANNGWAKWYYNRGGLTTSNVNDTSAPSEINKKWVIVGSADYFYILTKSHADDVYSNVYGYGAFKTLLNTENSCTFLAATLNYHAANTAYIKSMYSGLTGSNSTQTIMLQRGYQQTAMSVNATTYTLNVTNGSQFSGASNYIGAYNLTNISPLVPVFINETVLRGELVGLKWLLQDKPYGDLTIVSKQNEAYLIANAMVGTTSSVTGQIALKVGVLT